MGAVLSKYQVGPAVVTEALYEPLPSLTTVNSSEVPYISLDEFLADESLEDKQHQTDLTCNVTTSPPIRGQTIPFTIQPLENKSTKSTVGLQPMITGCSLTSSPTSSSSSLEHEDEAAAAAMGYHPSGTISQLSIFRRQTNNPLQLNFRENLSMVPRLSSTSPVSVSDEDNASPMHLD